MRRIPIHSRDGVVAHAKVDADDFDGLSGTRWYLSRDRYAYAPSTETIFMHRAVCCLRSGDPRVVHHENRDTLDNRRANLVICADQKEHRKQHTNWKLRLYSFEELCAMAKGDAA